MFEKPEDARMTTAEAEKYGQEINARNLQFDRVEQTIEANTYGEIPKDIKLEGEGINAAGNFEHIERHNEESGGRKNKKHVPLSEEEIKKLVGDQNFKNVKDGTSMGSINS